jgi:hypothetical protein
MKPWFVQLNAYGEVEPGSTLLQLNGIPNQVAEGRWERTNIGVEIDGTTLDGTLSNRWYFSVRRKYVVFGPIMLTGGADDIQESSNIWFVKE